MPYLNLNSDTQSSKINTKDDHFGELQEKTQKHDYENIFEIS